ncbi:MAG TPA: hypothetical protein VGN52_11460 [Burkholderiales bacterium]|jgi:hypothetical protein
MTAPTATYLTLGAAYERHASQYDEAIFKAIHKGLSDLGPRIRELEWANVLLATPPQEELLKAA